MPVLRTWNLRGAWGIAAFICRRLEGPLANSIRIEIEIRLDSFIFACRIYGYKNQSKSWKFKF